MKTERNIWNYMPPTDCSWYWKKLNSLIVTMVQWYHNNQCLLTTNGAYSVTRSYNALIETQTRLQEANLIWSNILQPKHRFFIFFSKLGKITNKRGIIQWIRSKHWNYFRRSQCFLFGVQCSTTQGKPGMGSSLGRLLSIQILLLHRYKKRLDQRVYKLQRELIDVVL